MIFLDQDGCWCWVVVASFSHPPSEMVTEQENRDLMGAVIADEVRRVVWSMVEDKVLGPNDFPPLFFRRYWPLIQSEVVAVVPEYFATSQMPKRWK